MNELASIEGRGKRKGKEKEGRKRKEKGKTERQEDTYNAADVSRGGVNQI